MYDAYILMNQVSLVVIGGTIIFVHTQLMARKHGINDQIFQAEIQTSIMFSSLQKLNYFVYHRSPADYDDILLTFVYFFKLILHY